jgi:DNA-binding SARP family transcriptional activator
MQEEQHPSASPTLHIYLLGDFRLIYDGQALTTVDTARMQSLLAYLVLHRKAPQSRQHLAFLLWPDSTDRQARTNLRKQVHYLRHALPEHARYLHADAKTLGWVPDAPFRLDVAEFESALDQAGHPVDAGSAQAVLEQAVTSYVGDLLPSCYDEWIFPARERLYQRYTQALEQLIESLEGQRDYPAAIRYSQRLLQHDPLHEAAHRRLMRLYVWSGQRAAALDLYTAFQRVLKEELGVPPDASTTELYTAVQAGAELPPSPEWTVGPVSAPVPARHNVPIQLTPFVGREDVLAKIDGRLRDNGCRMLTLVGPGGSDKTHLALETAAAQVDANRYEHGIFFVPLAPVNSVETVVPTVARILDFRFYEGVPPLQQLLDFLRAKSVLFVMDNCEQLLTPSLSSSAEPEQEGNLAGLFTDVLRVSPGVKAPFMLFRLRILIASHSPLDGERTTFPASIPAMPPVPPAGAGSLAPPTAQVRYRAIDPALHWGMLCTTRRFARALGHACVLSLSSEV